MTTKSPDLSEEMYRRVYRLIKRQIDPKRIAATLNIPIRMVLNIVNRLENAKEVQIEQIDDDRNKPDQSEFLDIYIYQKTRYSIVQLVGNLSEKNTKLLDLELERVLASSYKAIAIKLTDVISADKAGIDVILSHYEKFSAHGRYMALLDPSPVIEPFLIEMKIEDKIPVFGTERAFEESAFARK